MHIDKKLSSTRFGRFKTIGAGLVLLAVGTLRMRAGFQVVMHGNGQPVFSWGLIGAGVLCIALALIPESWVARAVRAPAGRNEQIGRLNSRGNDRRRS